jgi:hypothetical protein
VRLSLPWSIVLASVIVSLGLYFGLRRPAPDGGALAKASGAGAPQTGAAAAPGPMPSDEQLRAEVVAAVEGARARWTAACWDTANSATRTAGRYVSVLAFDAAGELDVSGISEVRGASDPAVAQCLRVQVNPFRISAPGRMVSFEIPFALP